MTAVDFTRLTEFLAIESVSLDPSAGPALRRAADWLCEELRAGGASARTVGDSPPLVVAELANSEGRAARPHVILYGHYDVQPAGDPGAWSTPPFTATRVGEWVQARGIADDKGQLYMLVSAVLGLAAEGRLPVDVTVIVDGEEETGGDTACRYLAEAGVAADAAIIFDGSALAPDQPVISLGGRGNCTSRVTVRTGGRDVHCGQYGGAALNAAHVLHGALAAVLPVDGRLPAELYAGATAPTAGERAAWDALPPAMELLRRAGAVPAPGTEGEFYTRTLFEPAIDVIAASAGSTGAPASSIPARAEAVLSIRLAPGQDVATIAGAVERLLREATPAPAELTLTPMQRVPPSTTDASSPVVAAAQDAFRAVLGVDAALVRMGGTLPILSALAERGIPAIDTGFALPDSHIHGPNERLRLADLGAGVAVARELLLGLGRLSPAARESSEVVA